MERSIPTPKSTTCLNGGFKLLMFSRCVSNWSGVHTFAQPRCAVQPRFVSVDPRILSQTDGLPVLTDSCVALSAPLLTILAGKVFGFKVRVRMVSYFCVRRACPTLLVLYSFAPPTGAKIYRTSKLGKGRAPHFGSKIAPTKSWLGEGTEGGHGAPPLAGKNGCGPSGAPF